MTQNESTIITGVGGAQVLDRAGRAVAWGPTRREGVARAMDALS